MRKLLATLALVLIAACGREEPAEPVLPSMSGSWSGNTQQGVTLDMTVMEREQLVTGAGRLRAGQNAFAFTVEGPHVYPNVSLTIRIAGFADLNYTGHFLSDVEITGTIHGSGFRGNSLALIRR